ncbi:MAG TPA: tetratricopeptide repeat protein [Verrucomicrobiae bacterium]|nr:tetratricopeptide repeat protein [Verrucomicrobiae bacterium]
MFAGILLTRQVRGEANVSTSPYAGSASCAACHKEAYDSWLNSNHHLAERPLEAQLDDAAFQPSRTVTVGSQNIAVSRTNGQYRVTLPGPSNQLASFKIERVIGHDPFRQFLVSFPKGRFQALEAAYDPGRNEWFDVFGSEDRRPGEWGHWTGRGLNWNSMCASCHNTGLRENYDEGRDAYNTTMVEAGVGCESCHGPLKTHIDWQRQYGKSGRKDPTIGKLSPKQMMDTCGVCHSRRSDLTGDFKPGDSFFDHQDLTIVDGTDGYFPDGQVHDEDYEYASFLSSRMHTNGVTCMDCHQPHSAKTILPGNLLCLRCHNGSFHNAPVIDPSKHTFHTVPATEDLNLTKSGGECVNCHMPQTSFMQRQRRHDHGFTIPDPLLTKEYGIPNACNRCHADKSVDWALAAVEKWYGPRMDRPTRRRAQWIARARAGDVAAREPLIALLSTNESSYWQAVAKGLLGQWADQTNVFGALLRGLENPDPLARVTAVGALAPFVEEPGGIAVEAIRKRLDDPSQNVRVAAAWALRSTVDPSSTAGRELVHYLDINSSQPAGQMQKGQYDFARGDVTSAIERFQKAVTWDPGSAPIREDLALALSNANRTGEAVAQLEEACRLAPHDAEYRFKLALAWNETGDLGKAVDSLKAAVKIDPNHDRAWYNLGLALNAKGDSDAALDALAHAEKLSPADPRIPYARATILIRLGRNAEARTAAAKAIGLDPSFTDAQKLLESLSQP